MDNYNKLFQNYFTKHQIIGTAQLFGELNIGVMGINSTEQEKLPPYFKNRLMPVMKLHFLSDQSTYDIEATNGALCEEAEDEAKGIASLFKGELSNWRLTDLLLCNEPEDTIISLTAIRIDNAGYAQCQTPEQRAQWFDENTWNAVVCTHQNIVMLIDMDKYGFGEHQYLIRYTRDSQGLTSSTEVTEFINQTKIRTFERWCGEGLDSLEKMWAITYYAT